MANRSRKTIRDEAPMFPITYGKIKELILADYNRGMPKELQVKSAEEFRAINQSYLKLEKKFNASAQ